ncbi:MAG: hypothetical protein AAF585_12645 [Verrucomicrobiota bacterium]
MSQSLSLDGVLGGEGFEQGDDLLFFAARDLGGGFEGLAELGAGDRVVAGAR